MTPSEAPTRSVLFVCLGNICRSPLAEGVFRHLARERGVEDRFIVDSAGTGAWHVGSPPDPRSTETAARHGIRLEGKARQVRPGDAERFDLVLAMDRSNLRDLEGVLGSGTASRARLRLFRDYDPEAQGTADVPDPYYGGAEGFEEVQRMVVRTCEALLDAMLDPDLPSPEPEAE
jgi:protein-tyrosine phosphatase